MPFVFVLELLGKVVGEMVVNIFSTKIKDQDFTFTVNLLVEAIGDCSSHCLVDDSVSTHSRDSSGILCVPPLRVVEVRREFQGMLLQFPSS